MTGPCVGRASGSAQEAVATARHVRHPFWNAFRHFPRCACCSRGAETTGSREAAPPFIAGEERGRPSRSPLGLAPRTGLSPAWGRGHRALRPGGRGRPGDSAFLPHCTHREKRVPASAPPLTWALGTHPRSQKERNCQAPRLHTNSGRAGSLWEEPRPDSRGPSPKLSGRCQGLRLPTWLGALKSAWKTWVMSVGCSIFCAKVYF